MPRHTCCPLRAHGQAAVLALISLGSLSVANPASADSTMTLATRGSGAAEVPVASPAIRVTQPSARLAAAAPGVTIDPETALPSYLMTDQELGLESDPEFRRAGRMRVAGIVVTCVGLVEGAVLGGLAWSMAQGNHAANHILAEMFGMMAAGTLVPHLAVGVPLWAVGQSNITRLRNQRRGAFLPAVNLAVSTSGASVGGSWRF